MAYKKYSLQKQISPRDFVKKMHSEYGYKMMIDLGHHLANGYWEDIYDFDGTAVIVTDNTPHVLPSPPVVIIGSEDEINKTRLNLEERLNIKLEEGITVR